MTALDYTISLSAKAGSTDFRIRKRPCGSSTRDHTSWYGWPSLDRLRAVAVNATDHVKKPLECISENHSIYTDDFPELGDRPILNESNGNAFLYGRASTRTWENTTVPAVSSEQVGRASPSVPVSDLALPDPDTATHESDEIMFQVSVKAEDLTRLHQILGHPSASQFLKLLRTSSSSRTVPRDLSAAVSALDCDFCERRARRRTPTRPRVAVPKTIRPGQDLHLDIGNFVHRQTGPFSALISTDKFSFYVCGAVLPGPANACNTIEAFLATTPQAYVRVTYDLGANF
jgi:hypothetical protein